MYKVCFINFDLTIHGGAQRVLVNIVKSIHDKYDIHVVSLIAENGECNIKYGKENIFLDENIKYKTILPYKARIRQVIRKGRKLLKHYLCDNQIDVVIFVGNYAGFCGSIMSRGCQCKKIFCDHGALLNQWNDKPVRMMRMIATKSSDITVVLTEQSKKAYMDKFKKKSKEVITIYNWLDEEVAKQSGEYDKESKNILTVGRVAKEKGYDLLLEVAKKMLSMSRDWLWNIYGDGDMMEEIKEKIISYGLSEHVFLKGSTNSIYECYKGHALYVLTSYREGLPLVLLEAKVNHIPIVSFDIISGPSEMINNGVDGILVPPYDINEMAESIMRLLANQEKRVQMSEAATDNLKLFSKEKILSQWMALIEEIAKPNP